MKAIETVYNGYKFRSRLEARWAVFFDRIRLKYEYEPQGYEMPSGARYLPDFYWPTLKLHVEVKSDASAITREDVLKLIEFAAECENRTVLIIGSPTNEVMLLCDRTSLDDLTLATHEFENYYETGEEYVRAVWLDMEEFNGVRFGTTALNPDWTLLPLHGHIPNVEGLLREAYLEAKQARFEFGETPKRPNE